MTDFFTADLHLGHGKVAHIRGFDTVQVHDITVVSGLDIDTKPGDNIWILGDLTGGREGDEQTALRMLTNALPNRHLHLIAGNHDSIHPMHRRSEAKHEAFRETFTSIDSMGTFRHNRDKVMLSHFPYEGDRDEERYPEYRLRDWGKPLVHGHTHSSQKVSHSDRGTIQVCVSLDAWGMKPASKEDIVKLINEHQDGVLTDTTDKETP